MRRRWFVLFLALAAATPACAPTPEDSARRADMTPLPVAPAEVVRDSVAAMAERLHVPGVALASIKYGELQWTRCIGVTRAGGDSITAETVFAAASLGKPLFAYGVMKLADEGRIDLFVPLARYLPDLRGAAADSGVTAARVLSHTSGLTLNAAGDGLELAFRPGEGWKYSGAAYAVLQRAVEHITGMPVEPWMQAEVLQPLGMTHTSYLAGTVPGPSATGHTREGAAIVMSPAAGAGVAGTLHTTVTDYAKFVIVSFQTEKMWAARGMVSADLQMGYGLGWGIAGPPPPAFLAWGSNPGFKSLAMGIPGFRSGFVMLTSGDNGLEIATAVAPMLLGHEYSALGFFMLHPDD